jgi:SAM-dependent methyltransferase
MNVDLASNYAYWQQHGRGWFEEYEKRKTFILYFHLQEIFLTEYMSRHAPARVLEFGCGVGRHLRNLRLVPGVEVHGYDQSPTMIADMENWTSREWIDERVRVGDPVSRLPYDDGSFDVVFTCEVLVHIRPEDLQPIIRELIRVSRGRILHLEPGPGVKLIDDAHGGCWSHDLVSAYEAMGLKAELLPQLFASQTPIQVTLNDKAAVEPPFSETTSKLFYRMESALTPLLDRGVYEERLTEADTEKPELSLDDLFDGETGELRIATDQLSRTRLVQALSLLSRKLQDLQRRRDETLVTEQKHTDLLAGELGRLNRKTHHLESHLAYLERRLAPVLGDTFGGPVTIGQDSAIDRITLDILPESNEASQGSQVWIRYARLEHEGPMIPWNSITLTKGWRLVPAEGCMYDHALLGEGADQIVLPAGTDPEINFMGHPWSGRIKLYWQEREYIVDLYRTEVSEISVRLKDLN